MLPLISLMFMLAGDCPMHAQHVHATEVDHRGDEAMGFSHETTRHAFRLEKNGGTIEVTASSADDAKSIAAIREHLQSIAKSFAAGDFAKPMFIHDKMPDGAEMMRTRKDAIRYRYEERPAGARVVITTDDPEARAAIHQFLRFQIAEHRTGDPTEP